MSYQQEWEEHKKLVLDIKMANAELQITESVRKVAQESNHDGQKQSNTIELDAKIEQLRIEKLAAETRKGAFEQSVSPEHTQWLEENIPPMQEDFKRDIHENLIKPLKDFSEKVVEVYDKIVENKDELAEGFGKLLLDTSGQSLTLENPNDMLARELVAQNQIVIEQQYSAEEHQQVIEKSPNDLKPVQNLLKDEVKKLEDGIIKTYEESGKAEIPEKTNAKPDAALKWENDIYEQGQKLLDGHDKKLAALEKNKTVLEKEKDGADEKKLDELKPMDELMKKEQESINIKLSEGIDKFREEKVALKNAIETTKDKQGIERNDAIQELREVFERQQREQLNRGR